ncbi:unnamed protein product [Rotaria magnacalcarata]|uniref:Uncharacterized protein n=4 Tax=Rotaria magnacalcarata TaxID=392030 RepID=A0A815BB55_9BILA|nr:unnamed protein product [Rotaria magnacalcarata]CAF3832178.1 unnamed protein product [Rotaria magnacalcarata]
MTVCSIEYDNVTPVYGGPWSSSRNTKNYQYSWCIFEEAAKHFQEKMEAVQKELINGVKKLSSSSTPVAFNVNPNISFLPDEPVLIAAEEPLFDITNENENIIDMAIRLSSQSAMMLNKIKDLVNTTRLPFHVKYRLELRPASFYDTDIQHQLWELRMNLDPVRWFDWQWRQCGDDQEKQHTCLAKAPFQTVGRFSWVEEKLLVQQEIWPVEAVAINFGQWETAGSYDKRLMDCHAYAHLLLDLTFINACDDTFFSALKGRVDQPPNYLKQNTQLLHFERLQNYEFDSQQMANFSQRLNNEESNLKGVTTDLQNVQTDLQGLKDVVQNLTTGMEAMTTLLGKVYASVNNQPVEPPVNALQTSLNKGHDLLNSDPNGGASK